MRVGATVFSKSILSPGLFLSWSFDYRAGFSWVLWGEPFGLLGCYLFRPKSGIYEAKKKIQGTQLCVISEVPIYQYHYTSFSPPFSLLCVLYILPSVFRYTQWNREIPLLYLSISTKSETFCISNYICVDLVSVWQQESKSCFTIH